MARGFWDSQLILEGLGLGSARPEASPYLTQAAHHLRGTRDAAAGGSPGHWEGVARVSVGAPPASCWRPLGWPGPPVDSGVGSLG